MDAFVATARAIDVHPFDETLQLRLQTLGLDLVSTFARLTGDYASVGVRQRTAFANVVLFTCVVELAAVLLLYFVVMRRRQESIIAAVEESESQRARFAAMFDNSSEMMAIYQRDGRIVRANRAAMQRLGFGGEAVGANFEMHVAPSGRQEVARYFADAVNGRGSAFETTFLDARGEEVPVFGSLAPIVVHENVVGVVGAARDVTAEIRIRRDLTESRERFRSLFASSISAVMAVDANGIVTDANAAFVRLTGYEPFEILGKPFDLLVPPGTRPAAWERFKELMDGRTRSYEASVYTKTQQTVEIAVDATPIRVGEDVVGVFYTSKDVSLERAMQRQVAAGADRLRALLRVSASSWQPSAQIDEALLLGTRALRMEYGYVVRIRGNMMTVRHRHGPDDFLPIGLTMPPSKSIGSRLAASARALAISDMTVEPFDSEMRERGFPWKSYIGSRIVFDEHVYGTLIFLDRAVRERPFDDADVDFVDIMSSLIASAVGREVQAEELRDRAFQDPLTGLANRAVLEMQFAGAVARARRANGVFALYYVDLDRFKPINDRYGHEAGDEVLKEVARRLSLAVRGEDVVARVGGDEFVIVQHAADERAVSALRERLQAAFVDDVQLRNGVAVNVGASAGLASYPADGEDLPSLLKVADARMYGAKSSKRVAGNA
ncbi:MAG: diguanylate cyclase [Candidatus Eremiobacteraeota bacterium]|nr:diguanylate cyclase [Candidatus Eremiobacteraeota bacterium]